MFKDRMRKKGKMESVKEIQQTLDRMRKKGKMESMKEIQQTLQEFDILSPDILRAAFGIPGASASPVDISEFFATVFQPREPCGRMEYDTSGNLKIDWASCYIPYHDEDAHFGYPAASVIGVADGVGGWRSKGVDAGAFSRTLMMSAFTEVLAHPPGMFVSPYTLLERAYGEAAAANTPGSSTACILSLSDMSLNWAYVGDSGFTVLREGKIIYRSKVQQSYFNCPFQLGINSGDCLSLAEVGDMPVKEGDIVVVGTDGLFDNMFDHELAQAVQVGMALGFSPKNMADIIGGLAYEMSRTKKKDSPFAVASQKQSDNSAHHFGGKKDDITVVVAFIQA